jgi:crotonobetainyl-CoA:carnitine CoA-transferase CaiB-like acyl-CoA transferase
VSAYRTRDGRHIQLVFLQGDRYWAEFCALAGRDDLAADPRFTDMAARRANREECAAALEAEFATRTYAEWKDLLAGIDAPWAPVQAVEELLDDPQVVANGYVGEVDEDGLRYRLPTVPVQFDERPPPMRRAPEHGEHTEAILLGLGYTWEQVAALKDAGAVP